MHRSNSSEYPSALLRNDAVASGTTTISAQQVGSTYVSVTYKTLSGNQPQAFGNVISVWNGTNIGWDNRPSAIVTVPITQDTPDGDMVISLGSEPSGGPPYMVAYGTSKSGTTYCAAQIGGVEQPFEPITTKISLRWLGTDSLLAEFSTPPQNDPRANCNWIGLWEGQSFSYNGINRIAKVPVDTNTATGSQDMNGLKLKFKTF